MRSKHGKHLTMLPAGARMAEVLKILGENDDRRVFLGRRSDGLFTFWIRAREGTGWGPDGPDLGLYDSADTAETEARSRYPWLRTP
jgi:hypothetical protein